MLIQCRDGGWYAASREEMEAIFGGLGTDQNAPEARQAVEERLGKERTPLMKAVEASDFLDFYAFDVNDALGKPIENAELAVKLKREVPSMYWSGSRSLVIVAIAAAVPVMSVGYLIP